MRKSGVIIAAIMAMLSSCGGKDTSPQPLSKGVGTDTLSASRTSTDSSNAQPYKAVAVGRTVGKVVAERYADLSFESTLPIERVFVKNGQHVRRGQAIAMLDCFKLRNAVEQQRRAIQQAQLQMEQADLQMQDVVIAQGYDPEQETLIPQKVRRNADVKSGYAIAKNQLATARTQLAAAEHELQCGSLTAPFDGVVANLKVQAHQLAQPGQVVCRIIATGSMDVEFRVMETDLNLYRIGTAVKVVPVADKSVSYDATVTEINPVVDEQGAITLRARLTAGSGLFDGMNVEIERMNVEIEKMRK